MGQPTSARCGPTSTIRNRAAIWIVALAFAAYLSNGHIIGQIDSRANSLLPVAVLINGSLTFDELVDAKNAGATRGFQATPHGLVALYPIATGLMILPIYAPAIAARAVLVHPSPVAWDRFAWRFQKLPAALIAALGVLAFARLSQTLGWPPPLALGLTLWFAFGSEMFSTSAQALWQHGPGTLTILALIDAVVRLGRRSDARTAIAFSVWFGLAIAIRPTNAMIVSPFAVIALLRVGVGRTRLLFFLLAPAAGILALLVGYNVYFFHDVLGGYGQVRTALSLAQMDESIPGLLLSPGRGLLIYFPIAAVAAGLLIMHPVTLRDPIATAIAAAVGATLLTYSCYRDWWGGWSFGPRLLSEIEPLILLLVGQVFCQLGPRGRRATTVLCFYVLLPYAIGVQVIGVYSAAAVSWNGTPVDVDQAPERLWEVADNPIWRGLRCASIWRSATCAHT